MNALLAWYFVAVWGAGYLATKIGLQHAAPFTFLSLRFAFGLVVLLPVIFLWRPAWPRDRRELAHVAIAGLLMHAVQLGGSHYAQYLGMSAGVIAVILASQPLFTALFVSSFTKTKIQAGQWAGVLVGLAGVALVVWHKIDVREVATASLVAAVTGLTGITAATLYQRRFAAHADLRATSFIQFAATLAVVAPLALAFEGFSVRFSYTLLGAIAFLVIGASILGVSAFYYLLRHGEATRVTSMMYLPPVFAVVLELAMFHVVPSAVTLAGMAVACAGVAMAVWTPRWKSSTSSR